MVNCNGSESNMANARKRVESNLHDLSRHLSVESDRADNSEKWSGGKKGIS
jgi:hypothetical protein